MTQLEFQINKILEAFHTLVTGSVPPSLMTPDILYYIFTNVTLSLPEGYELLMGAQYSNLPWYYKYAKAALLADLNSFLLVMIFPLIAVNRNYELYKVVAFPSKIWNSTYLRYKFDSEYFAISTLQQTYLSLSENDFKQCEGQSVKICPANDAVTDNRTKSCAPSLFFQRQDAQKACQRIVTIQQPSPILKRLGSLVLYFSPEMQAAHL